MLSAVPAACVVGASVCFHDTRGETHRICGMFGSFFPGFRATNFQVVTVSDLWEDPGKTVGSLRQTTEFQSEFSQWALKLS